MDKGDADVGAPRSVSKTFTPSTGTLASRRLSSDLLSSRLSLSTSIAAEKQSALSPSAQSSVPTTPTPTPTASSTGNGEVKEVVAPVGELPAAAVVLDDIAVAVPATEPVLPITSSHAA